MSEPTTEATTESVELATATPKGEAGDTAPAATAATAAKPDAAAPGRQPETTTDNDTLGDGGRKALAEERRLRRDAERRLAEIESAELRRTVAAAKGMTDAQARFITGSTEDEMQASADDLLAAFAPAESPGRRRPTEALRPGAAPGSERPDYGAVADRIMQGS